MYAVVVVLWTQWQRNSYMTDFVQIFTKPILLVQIDTQKLFGIFLNQPSFCPKTSTFWTVELIFWNNRAVDPI